MPPPFGGIAILNKALIDAGLKKYFDLIIIDTAIKGKYEKIDEIRSRGILHGVICYFKLFWVLLSERELKNIFLTGTCNSGLIRDFGFIAISKLFNKNILFNFHGTRKYSERNILIKWLTRKSIQWSEFILSPTRIDWEKASSILPQQNKNIKLFYNSSYIPEQLTANNLNEKTDKPFKIIGTGRLSEAKGTFDLIDVFISLVNDYSNIELTWIGRGATPEDEIRAQRIIEKVPNMNLRIHLLKDLSEEEKFRELSTSDLFVLPTKNDNLPIAILEALALGLPVISCNMGAIPEVIIPGINGWLINPGDTKALKCLIVYALNESLKLEQIGKNNINHYKSTFASESRVNEIINIC